MSYLRSLLLVTVILSVSSASHVLASGHLPAPMVMLLFGVLLLIPTLLVTRRSVGLRTAMLLMGSGQFLLHHLFSITALPPACGGSAAPTDHHAAFEAACAPSAVNLSGSPDSSPVMVLLHGLATVILALAVSRSEEALALLAVWIRPLPALPSGAGIAPAPRRPLMSDVASPVPPLSVHASVPTLRGPPHPGAPIRLA